MPKRGGRFSGTLFQRCSPFILCTALSGLPTRGRQLPVHFGTGHCSASLTRPLLPQPYPTTSKQGFGNKALTPLLLSMAGHLGGCEFEVSPGMGLCNERFGVCL